MSCTNAVTKLAEQVRGTKRRRGHVFRQTHLTSGHDGYQTGGVYTQQIDKASRGMLVCHDYASCVDGKSLWSSVQCHCYLLLFLAFSRRVLSLNYSFVHL